MTGKVKINECENPKLKIQIIIKSKNVLLLSFSITFSARYIAKSVNNASVVYCFNSLEKKIKRLLNEHKKRAIEAVYLSKNLLVSI